MKAVFNALNVVHEEQETRGFIKLTALTLACTAGVILFMVIALVGVVVVPAVLNFMGLGGVTEMLMQLAALAGAVARRGRPARGALPLWPEPRARRNGAGSATAAWSPPSLWVIVSLLFSWYVANFGNYNKTYGSLGAVVGFMTWIWISARWC